MKWWEELPCTCEDYEFAHFHVSSSEIERRIKESESITERNTVTLELKETPVNINKRKAPVKKKIPAKKKQDELF